MFSPVFINFILNFIFSLLFLINLLLKSNKFASLRSQGIPVDS